MARGFLAGLTLAWLLPAPSVRALEFGEDFDRDWSQPGAATCHAGQEVFVRRVANDACGTDYGGAWEGGSAADHDAPWCASADTCGSLAVHRFSDFVPGTDGVGVANSGVLEIMTSARRQSSRQGRLQVDFHVHEDVPLSGAGEHYLILHNLQLTEANCDRDCAAIPHSSTNQGNGPGRYRWYGVIAGAFGEPADPQSPIHGGSIGFAVEVPHAITTPLGRPNDLIDASFLPYSVNAKGETFPAGWYRISISLAEADSGETYTYTVHRFADGKLVPIVPDDAALGGTHRRTFPARLLNRALGRALPPGYVGVSVAWLGGASRVGAHVDWDNLEVDW